MSPSSKSLRYSVLATLVLLGAGCSSASTAPQIQAVPVEAPLPTETAPAATTTLDMTATTTAEATTTEAVPLPTVAVLENLKGNVRVARSGSTMYGVERLALQQGDVVDVATAGSATIVWTAYGRTTLAGGSRVELKLATTTADTNTIGVRMNLDVGKIWTRLERLLGADSSFSVRAGDTVATVRGTSFGVERKGKTVRVSVMVSHVGVARVKDVAFSATSTEVVVGTSALLAPMQEMNVDQTKKSLPAMKLMTKTELNDQWLVAGNAPVTNAEMQMTPDVSAQMTSAPALSPMSSDGATTPSQSTKTEPATQSTQDTQQPTPAAQQPPAAQQEPAPTTQQPAPAETQPTPAEQTTPPAQQTQPAATAPDSGSTSTMIEQGLNKSGTTGTVAW